MTRRRDVIAAGALLLPLPLALKGARADEAPSAGAELAKMADFLFVQNAKGVIYSDGKLSLARIFRGGRE